MVLPAVAGAARIEAVGSAATMGGRPLQVDASAGPIPGSGGCSGAAAPYQAPPTAVEEGPALHSQEKRRSAGGSASSSSSSSGGGEEPLSPALQLAVAEELIYRFGMAQQKRELSDCELSLVRSLLDKMPALEAAVGACGERPSPRWGFTVRAPVRWARLQRAASRPLPPPSGEEPLAPARLQLEIAREVVSRLTSLVKFLEDRVPGLKAASGVSGGATPLPSKVAPSGRVPAKARRAVAAKDLSPVTTLRPGGQVATPAAAHVTVGRQVVTRSSGEGNAHATSGVHNKMSEANGSHTGQELSSEDESSSSSSSRKGHLPPALLLEIAKEVINGFTMAQEMRMLSADEHSLIKFLEGRIPVLEAEVASEFCGSGAMASSGHARLQAKARRIITTILSSPVTTPFRPGLSAPLVHPPSHQVAAPAAYVTVDQQAVTRCSGEEDVYSTSGVHNKMSEVSVVSCEHHTGHELSSEHESLSSSSSSSSEEPLTPALQLETAKEVISRLTMAKEKRMLSADENSLIKFLEDRIPSLEAEVASEVCGGGATPSPAIVAPSSRACALVKESCAVAVDQQVVTKFSGEEDAYATSGVHNKMPEANVSHEHRAGQELSCENESLSSSSSSSSKEPLTPALLLEIAKELINGLTMAQEKRMLSADEHWLIKFLEGRIPALEAEVASEVCGGGETLSPSKVAPFGHACLQAKARRVIATILSRPVTTPFRPGLSAPLVHPPSHQVAAPAAYVTVDQQVITRYSGEEDAYATSGVHNKMPDANVSHDHGRGQELSNEHEFLSEKHNSGCDLGVVTEKSGITIAPETAPPPSDVKCTAESSCASNRWGTAPEAEDFDDFGLPDDLGIY